MKSKPLTVKDLIAFLEKVPKTYKVNVQNANDYLCYTATSVTNDAPDFKSVTIFSEQTEWDCYDDN